MIIGSIPLIIFGYFLYKFHSHKTNFVNFIKFSNYFPIYSAPFSLISFYKDQMIAGVLNFIVKDDVALAFYISHKDEFQDLRPLNLLFYNIFKWALNKNIKVYDFGIFTVDGEPNMGLGRFKENFGASGIFRDTFQIIL